MELSKREKNTEAVKKFRLKLKSSIGEAQYKKQETEARQNRRQKQKEREKVNNANQVQNKTKSMMRAELMVGDIFTRVLDEVKKKEQGPTKKKLGRKPKYELKDDLTEKEKAKIRTKLKRREYMRLYMQNYKSSKVN